MSRTKILIDAGPSPHGFHGVEPFLRCPTAYRWKRDAKLRAAALGPAHVADPPADPLVRGSIGHVGLAHHYARQAAVARGLDPEAFHDPVAAMTLLAERFGASGARLLPVAVAAVERHVRQYLVESFEVVAVERLLETDFEGFPYTARADLVVRNAAGRVVIYDHKFVGRIDDAVFRRYALSGQFLGLATLGARHFGPDFGGVMLNVVECNGTRLVRRQVEPAPYALQRYPRVIADAKRRIRDLEEAGSAEAWPMAVSETTCMTNYGPCEWFERCRWG